MPGGLVRVGSCFFRCDPQSRETLVDGSYESSEKFASRRYVRRDIPVIEFGGALGVVSCLLNKRLDKPYNHVVVEANPETLPILRENRDRNRCNFEILHGAAGAVEAKVRIYLGQGALYASSYAPTDSWADVSAVSLDLILQARGFDRCAVVCDIEGSEISFIRSEIGTLKSRVEIFIVEFHPKINGIGATYDSRRLLKNSGFEELWSERDVFVFRNTRLESTI